MGLVLGLDKDGIGLPMSQVSKPVSWARRQLLWLVIGPRFGLVRPTKKDFNWAQIGPLGLGLEPKKKLKIKCKCNKIKINKINMR